MNLKQSSLMCLIAAALACTAQQTSLSAPGRGLDPALRPLGQSAPLNVWLIHTMFSLPVTSQPDLGYHEQNAGDFGHTASSTGDTSSNTGITSGSFGHASSEDGQTSGSYGQTAGSFGQPSSNYGQTAGSYGSPSGDAPPGPGNYSETAGSYSQRAVNLGKPLVLDPASRASLRDPLLAGLPGIRADLGPSHINFVDVDPSELVKRLAATAGTLEFPDVLVGNPLPGEWSSFDVAGRYGIAMLGTPGIAEPGESSLLESTSALQIAILVSGRNREAAEAFVTWVRDPWLGIDFDHSYHNRSMAEAIEVATSAASAVLVSGQVGGAVDEALAKFSPRHALLSSLQPPNGSSYGTSVHTGLVSAAANDRLAVVALRCILTSPGAFGVAHPLVVMRRGEDKHWKVLQISPDLTPHLLEETFNTLATFTQPLKVGESDHVGGITQAAPVDGDNRLRFPELWWDNGGGAGLLVVEWQKHESDGEWDPSHMDMVLDRDQRLKIRVPATFASQVAEYRWRVWSVAPGGAMKISPWRTLNILG